MRRVLVAMVAAIGLIVAMVAAIGFLLPMGSVQEVKEAPAKKESRTLDVIFVPTPDAVIEKMLDMAKVKKGDVVYDLGCGDGRIVVAAAKRGAKATGWDIDAQRVKEARANVKENNAEENAKILRDDIFTLDLSGANVITLYLLPELNARLIPQLEKLKPGSRIVSHDFNLNGIKPDEVVDVKDKDGNPHIVFLWTTPLKKEKAAEK